MRDYSRIDSYLDKLRKQIYEQPEDPLHTAWAKEAIDWFILLTKNVYSVIDMGCGTGFCQPFFKAKGISYLGICLGEDAVVARNNGRNVLEMDFSFTLSRFGNNCDLVFSRHSLEHSPFPLLTLMEWHLVTKDYLALVLPAHEHWGFRGRNHYFVLNPLQWENLFEVAGFEIVAQNIKKYQMSPLEGVGEVEIEYWYLLRKVKNVSE